MADEIRENADDLVREYVHLVLEACGVDKPTKDEVRIASDNAAKQLRDRLVSSDPSQVKAAMKELNNLRTRVQQMRVGTSDLLNDDVVKAVSNALNGSPTPSPEKAAEAKEKAGLWKDPEAEHRPKQAGDGDQYKAIREHAREHHKHK